ncbi:MAG: hypothetical protein CMM58_12220 [Rhodospirillaceae bacterium]|nr:hypothetical protein [Rhodospirillaceae bacterium]|tara:strand:+ start:2125 stop:3183 length:1059 start_codon:yes stop_codon:yes gene_type:complete
MLTKRFVIKLTLLTAIAVIAACIAHYERWSETIRNIAEDRVFPEIIDKLDQVAKIKIVRSSQNEVDNFTAVPSGNHWSIEEKGGYKTRDSAIRETLLGLTELVYQEAKTKDPDRHHKLHLQDVSKNSSKATRLILEDSNGDVILDALFGKRVQNLSGGTPSLYMRRSSEAQTWLTKGELEVRGDILDWLSVTLLSIQRERIQRAIFTTGSAPTLELSYNKDMERFDIVGLPSNREVKSRYQVLNVGIIPENLLLNDVRPATLSPDSNLSKVKWQTVDGLIVKMHLAKDKDNKVKHTWAFIEASTSGTASDKVKKEAEVITRKTEGWEFWLGDDIIKRLNSTSKSLTKPKSSD